jgi:hypothetical protein
MQHPILADGLISQDGRSLAFADNAHLFQWPGALVYGKPEAVATDDQDVFEQPKTWERQRYRTAATQAPFAKRRPLGRDKPAPEQSIRELRREYLDDTPLRRRGDGFLHSTTNPLDRPIPELARGHEGAAFEARRNRDLWLASGRDVDNPILGKLGINTLAADWPHGGGKPQFQEGAQWVLDALAKEFYNGSMVPPALLEAAGAKEGGKLLARYLHHDRAAEIVTRFEETIWAGLAQRIDDKIAQVQHELNTWARAGQLPVSRPEGGIDTALTLANAITATVGIYHLAKLGQALVDFKATVAGAIAGVLEGLGA